MHKTRITKGPTKRQKSQKNEIREHNRASKSKSRTNPKQKKCEEARVIWGDEGRQERDSLK